MEGLFQPMHLLVILIIVLLIFGPKKLGDLGKGLGEGIRNFKSSMNEGNTTKKRRRQSDDDHRHHDHDRREEVRTYSSVMPVFDSAARNIRYSRSIGSPTTLK